MNKTEYNNVDDYIQSFPVEVQQRMEKIRNLIKETAPDSIEVIAYSMPSYRMGKKPLVYFGAFTKHIGFYAISTVHARFKNKLSAFKQGKGSVQFPHNEDIPYEIIADMVKMRMVELKGNTPIRK